MKKFISMLLVLVVAFSMSILDVSAAAVIGSEPIIYQWDFEDYAGGALPGWALSAACQTATVAGSTVARGNSAGDFNVYKFTRPVESGKLYVGFDVLLNNVAGLNWSSTTPGTAARGSMGFHTGEYQGKDTNRKYVLGFDKNNNTDNVVTAYSALPALNVINASSAVIGTNLTGDTPYRVEWVYDLDTGGFNAYMNGVQFLTTTHQVPFESIGSFYWLTQRGLCIDNLVIYNFAGNEKNTIKSIILDEVKNEIKLGTTYPAINTVDSAADISITNIYDSTNEITCTDIKRGANSNEIILSYSGIINANDEYYISFPESMTNIFGPAPEKCIGVLKEDTAAFALAGVKFVDTEGLEYTLIDNEISPVLEKIELKFNKAVDLESLKNNMSIVEILESGEEEFAKANYTVTVQGDVATVSFTGGCLYESSDYSLKLPIMVTDGASGLAKEYTLAFETADSEIKGEFISNLPSLSGLLANDTFNITVEVVNPQKNGKAVYISYGIYDTYNKKPLMIDFGIVPVSFNDGATKIQQNITVKISSVVASLQSFDIVGFIWDASGKAAGNVISASKN